MISPSNVDNGEKNNPETVATGPLAIQIMEKKTNLIANVRRSALLTQDM